jgi:hypothetical protein
MRKLVRSIENNEKKIRVQQMEYWEGSKIQWIYNFTEQEQALLDAQRGKHNVDGQGASSFTLALHVRVLDENC